MKHSKLECVLSFISKYNCRKRKDKAPKNILTRNVQWIWKREWRFYVSVRTAKPKNSDGKLEITFTCKGKQPKPHISQ